MPTPTPHHGRDSLRADVAALLGALLVLAAIVTSITSCGSEDLVFPGNIPATATSEFTVTPTP